MFGALSVASFMAEGGVIAGIICLLVAPLGIAVIAVSPRTLRPRALHVDPTGFRYDDQYGATSGSWAELAYVEVATATKVKRSWRQTLVSIDFLARNPSDDAVRHPETKKPPFVVVGHGKDESVIPVGTGRTKHSASTRRSGRPGCRCTGVCSTKASPGDFATSDWEGCFDRSEPSGSLGRTKHSR